MGGDTCWIDALAPVSAWEGISIRVDAHAPVGPDLANHCRQPKPKLGGNNSSVQQGGCWGY